MVDDSGMYGGQFVANKDGFAVVAIDATDDGVTVAALTGTTEGEEGKIDKDDEKETEDGK